MARTEAAARVSTFRGFEHPVAFWTGAIACTAGVLLHLPMYFGARDMGYKLSGMTPDAPMITGMALIFAGLILALYGVLPRRSGDILRNVAKVRVAALDDAPIRPQHVALLIVMALAVTIDIMKPTTLAFVTPGVAKEYGLRAPGNPHGSIPVGWLPLLGIAGTVVGSWMWGAIGDRIGRRASILYAGLLFVTTSICGAMPGFTWNLVMCFLMGVGSGGMLPIIFALVAETIPARHRGWLMVLIGGDIAGAYVITSSLAGWLTPTYSWRILWLIGLPTGVLLILLNRWIPESPRYLLARGRPQEAEAVMVRYGAVAIAVPDEPAEVAQAVTRESYLSLARRPLLGTSFALTVLGIGVGLVTYGFTQWVPTNLQHLGYSAVNSDYVIRNAALLGLPLTVLVAWMYGTLGSRRTIISLSAVTALTLVGFAIAGNSLAQHKLLLSLLLVPPLAGVSAIVAVVAGYAAEVYPTLIRSRGTGLAAGMTKAGGVLILAVVVASKNVPSITVTALIGAVPLLMAAVAFIWAGPETKRRSLEDIEVELAAAQ
jgi:MFS transporter, putative metabolite:H+ symporter